MNYYKICELRELNIINDLKNKLVQIRSGKQA